MNPAASCADITLLARALHRRRDRPVIPTLPSVPEHHAGPPSARPAWLPTRNPGPSVRQQRTAAGRVHIYPAGHPPPAGLQPLVPVIIGAMSALPFGQHAEHHRIAARATGGTVPSGNRRAAVQRLWINSYAERPFAANLISFVRSDRGCSPVPAALGEAGCGAGAKRCPVSGSGSSGTGRSCPATPSRPPGPLRPPVPAAPASSAAGTPSPGPPRTPPCCPRPELRDPLSRPATPTSPQLRNLPYHGVRRGRRFPPVAAFGQRHGAAARNAHARPSALISSAPSGYWPLLACSERMRAAGAAPRSSDWPVVRISEGLERARGAARD